MRLLNWNICYIIFKDAEIFNLQRIIILAYTGYITNFSDKYIVDQIGTMRPILNWSFDLMNGILILESWFVSKWSNSKIFVYQHSDLIKLHHLLIRSWNKIFKIRILKKLITRSKVSDHIFQLSMKIWTHITNENVLRIVWKKTTYCGRKYNKPHFKLSSNHKIFFWIPNWCFIQMFIYFFRSNCLYKKKY